MTTHREPAVSGQGPRRRPRPLPIALALGLVWADPASAEPGSRLLDCRIVTLCQPDGSCQNFSGHEPIELTPLDTHPDGVGRYRIFYGDVCTTAEAMTGDGPFLWTERGRDRQSLLLTGSETAVWTSVDPEPAFSKTVFLECGSP